MKARSLVLALMLAAAPCIALAVDDPAEMLPDPRQEARAESIGEQLRCLVCQNESIEASGADLARDLRHVVRQHVAAGETNQQVMDWMVARYGNFIRLRPPLNRTTLILWAAPVLALIAGLVAAGLALRRKPGTLAPLTEAERARLADLTRRS